MNEPPVCARCGDEYFLRDGMEPTKYCDPCAHARVEELELLVVGDSAAPSQPQPSDKFCNRIDELATKYTNRAIECGGDSDVLVSICPSWIHGCIQEALLEFSGHRYIDEAAASQLAAVGQLYEHHVNCSAFHTYPVGSGGCSCATLMRAEAAPSQPQPKGEIDDPKQKG